MSRGGRSKPGAGAASKGDGRRIPRVEREIREVIGTYLLGGFRGELPGLVSVTRVIVSGDLRQAKVLVTIMGAETPASRKEGIQALQEEAYEIQNVVNRKLRMKHCPRLTFIYDDGFEHALKVENILRDIARDRGTAAGTAGTEPNEDGEN